MTKNIHVNALSALAALLALPTSSGASIHIPTIGPRPLSKLRPEYSVFVWAVQVLLASYLSQLCLCWDTDPVGLTSWLDSALSLSICSAISGQYLILITLNCSWPADWFPVFIWTCIIPLNSPADIHFWLNLAAISGYASFLRGPCPAIAFGSCVFIT